MNRLVASAFALLMAGAAVAAAPAVGEPQKKTELVGIDGQRIDTMRLRYDIDGGWVVDTQKVLYRDVRDGYYLVTLKQACEPLTIRGRGFSFYPADRPHLKSDRSYEIRPAAGQECDVARIEQIDEAKAMPMREASKWRLW